MPNVCFRHWGADDVCQPLVGILLVHQTGFIQTVKVTVCLPPQRPEIVVRQTPHRLFCPLMRPNIGITFRIPCTYIKHGSVFVIAIDSIRTAEYHRTAAVRAAHLLFLIPFLFSFFRIHGILPPLIEKLLQDYFKPIFFPNKISQICKKTYRANGAGILVSHPVIDSVFYFCNLPAHMFNKSALLWTYSVCENP